MNPLLTGIVDFSAIEAAIILLACAYPRHVDIMVRGLDRFLRPYAYTGDDE